MEQGPLSDPQLSEIEAKLNAGRFEEAQGLLAELGVLPGAESASAYFATRLLFQRGKLDRSGVVERLRDLLAREPYFPEAQRMLDAAESGVLEGSTEGFNRATRAPPDEVHLSESRASRPDSRSRDAMQAEIDLNASEIPRAPLLPQFSQPADIPDYLEPAPLPPTSSAAPPAKIPSLQVPAVVPRTQSADAGSWKSALDTLGPSQSGSGRPTHTPTLFEIAAALDAGDPAQAFELCLNATQAGPELTLLTARALSALGRKDQALGHLQRLLRAPLVQPVVRSASARLLIEMGHPEQALDQARQAVVDDPEDSVARVTCAWALLRLQLRTGDRTLADEADALIAATRIREGALSALFTALIALSMAERGDPAEALSLSQRVLEQDPRQLDAISAMAIAASRLGLKSETERARQQLFALNPEEARATEASLARRALPPPASVGGGSTKPPLSSVWGEHEAELVQGRRDRAVHTFESACTDRVRKLGRRGNPDAWFDLGSAAARLFNELPVLRHFAPYDRSVFSVERLDAALRVLYGKNARPDAEEPVTALLGAYVGESWRQAFGGDWQGVPLFPFSASVEATGMSVRPCERVLARLRDGLPLELDAPPSLHPGADPLGNSVPLSLAPPSPWDPDPWPTLPRLKQLGRFLPESVVGYYCASELEMPLDHSVKGIVAIDRYVNLLAPTKAPPDPDAAWARRASIILGAYIGEVLVDRVGAHWELASEEAGPGRYQLLFADGSSAVPITRVLDRLSGRTVSPLADYVTELASGRASITA